MEPINRILLDKPGRINTCKALINLDKYEVSARSRPKPNTAGFTPTFSNKDKLTVIMTKRCTKN